MMRIPTMLARSIAAMSATGVVLVASATTYADDFHSLDHHSRANIAAAVAPARAIAPSKAGFIAPKYGSVSETRSAQALPVVRTAALTPVAPTAAAAEGMASDPAAEQNCRRTHGYWDAKRLRCRRGGAYLPIGVVGGLAAAGFIILVATESGDHGHGSAGSGTGTGGGSVSN